MKLDQPTKAQKIKEQYYTLPEEEMQLLIERAKGSDQVAQKQILKVFNNFLTKYFTMLWRNKFSLSDYDIRRFIILYVRSPEVRRSLFKGTFNASITRDINETMTGINYMIRRYDEEEDVWQTIHMAFFQCIDVYQKKENIPFSSFLYSYFFYVLKKHVDTFLIYQLGRKTYGLLEYDESFDNDSGDNLKKGFIAPPGPSLEDVLYSEDIDEMWVMGLTASAPFDQLTLQDRQLLKWRFIDKMKTSEISKKITEHPNTIRDHFAQIEDKIKTIFREDVDLQIELGF